MIWRQRPADGAEARLKDLQSRFRSLRDRHDGIDRRRRLAQKAARAAPWIGAWLGLVLLAAWGLRASPWPAGDTVRHFLSFPNCDAARSVGLAPAARGAPGYYTRHDRDNDGIACEPFSPTG